jgi:hypothetical protein
VFFWSEFILISLISLSLTSTKRLAAILKISILLGEYNRLILVKLDQSPCRICYVHLCKNTKLAYNIISFMQEIKMYSQHIGLSTISAAAMSIIVVTGLCHVVLCDMQ